MSMTPGVTHLPVASMTSASAGALTVWPDRGDLAVLEQQGAALDDRARRRQDRGVADDRRTTAAG